MTATLKGAADLAALLADLPNKLGPNILRGAMRAGAKVIADDAEERCRSEEVKETITVTSRVEPGVIVAKVQTKGPGAYIAPWMEFGTDPHFISVDPALADGRTARRINYLDQQAAKFGREGPGRSLVIGGKFVGETVHHPGAKPYPFMRPALDAKQGAAVEAMGGYIASRLTAAGLVGAPTDQDDPE